MACFVVPMTEAVVTTVAQRIMKAHEKEEKLSPEMDCAEGVNQNFVFGKARLAEPAAVGRLCASGI